MGAWLGNLGQVASPACTSWLYYITPFPEASPGMARSVCSWLREVGMLTIVFTAQRGTGSSPLCLPTLAAADSPGVCSLVEVSRSRVCQTGVETGPQV